MFALELIFPQCRQPSVLHNVATLLPSADFKINNLPEKKDYENKFKCATFFPMQIICSSITKLFLKFQITGVQYPLYQQLCIIIFDRIVSKHRFYWRVNHNKLAMVVLWALWGTLLQIKCELVYLIKFWSDVHGAAIPEQYYTVYF